MGGKRKDRPLLRRRPALKLVPICYGKANGTPMKKPAAQSRESAEMLAIQALGFFAEEPDRLARFLAATGLTVEHIRAAARDPDFLAGVLEHMLGDESLLIAFADSVAIDPASVARAQQMLGGRWERDVP
jgi:hypothetical protein